MVSEVRKNNGLYSVVHNKLMVYVERSTRELWFIQRGAREADGLCRAKYERMMVYTALYTIN
jgi:hypothetical protein